MAADTAGLHARNHPPIDQMASIDGHGVVWPLLIHVPMICRVPKDRAVKMFCETWDEIERDMYS
ncbi:hypothetical protein [Bradyrhizobium sp. USDA 10063]